MFTPRRVTFMVDARSEEALEKLIAQGRAGMPCIAPGRRCDCCGAEESVGGCVRGVFPCDCDAEKRPPSARFRASLVSWWGVRCRVCHHCPAHCHCKEDVPHAS